MKIVELDDAISLVKLLISEHVDIIEICTRSTHPFEIRFSEDGELQRLVTMLDAILKIPQQKGSYYQLIHYMLFGGGS